MSLVSSPLPLSPSPPPPSPSPSPSPFLPLSPSLLHLPPPLPPSPPNPLTFLNQDKPMHLADGKFTQNGHCGYLLMPDCMFNPGFNPMDVSTHTNSRPLTLSVQVSWVHYEIESEHCMQLSVSCALYFGGKLTHLPAVLCVQYFFHLPPFSLFSLPPSLPPSLHRWWLHVILSDPVVASAHLLLR